MAALPPWLHPLNEYELPEPEADSPGGYADDDLTASPLWQAWQKMRGQDIPVPQAQTLPDPTGWERMGMAMSNVQPYQPMAGESAASAFLRALVSGTARSYGGAVLGRRASRQQKLEAENQQKMLEYQQTARRQDRDLMYGWPQIAGSLTKRTPQQEAEAAGLRETAIQTARAAAEPTFTLRRNIAGFKAGETIPRSDYFKLLDHERDVVRAQASSSLERLTPAQKEQLSAVDRKYEDRREIVKKKVERLDKQLNPDYGVVNERRAAQLNADIERAYGELDSLGTAWSTERGRIVGTVKPQPATTQQPTPRKADPQALSNYIGVVRSAKTIKDFNIILQKAAADPAVDENPEFINAVIAKRAELTAPQPVAETPAPNRAYQPAPRAN